MITFGQLLLAISIPSVLALVGILVNNHGLNMVRADITDLRNLNQHFIDDRAGFYRWHAVYLTLSGVQWLAMLAATWFMLAAWRAADIECRDASPEKS